MNTCLMMLNWFLGGLERLLLIVRPCVEDQAARSPRIQTVLDPGLFTTPVTTTSWLSKQQSWHWWAATPWGQSNPENGVGTVYWPGPDPSNLDLHASRWMLRFHRAAVAAGRY